MSDITTIDLIRHGEPVGGKRYRGQLDDPLSEKGWKQMRGAVADHCPWKQIVSSSLSRCAAFANELATRHQLPIELDSRLVEIGFGEWEGRTASEIQAEDEQALFNFWKDPDKYRPPGAESLAEFERRVIAGYTDVLQKHQGKHLLIVGHAGMMRMIIRHTLDMPLDKMFRLDVPNAGITRIKIEHYEDTQLPKLVFHAGQL